MSKNEVDNSTPNPTEGVKLSKRSLALAELVLDKSNGVAKDETGRYSVDLTHIVGMGFGSSEEKSKDATEDIKRQLASTIEDGSLVLGDEYTSKVDS